MDRNILIGGAAGLGMESLAVILEKVLKRSGAEIFALQDYMSRVRGGHNFFQIRFADQPLQSHADRLDVIIALDAGTVTEHLERLLPEGIVIADESIEASDSRIFRLPMKKTAEGIGNPKVFGTVALGALIKMFGLPVETAAAVLRKSFSGETASQNIRACEAGYGMAEFRHDFSEGSVMESIMIGGSDAIALGALAAGVKFYTAYPMTPSTGILNYMAKRMYDAGVVVEQAEDEIAAVNMAIGASYAGVRAMTGTSGGGFALMVEAVGLAGMLEVPLVIAEMQRPGPTTGFPTRTEQGDLKCVIYSSPSDVPKMAIALRDPEDAFYQTIRAFDLADKYQIPVILLGDQYLADCVRTVKPFDFSGIRIDRHLADLDEMQPGGAPLAEGPGAPQEAATGAGAALLAERPGEGEPGASRSEAIGAYRRYDITETGISPRIIPGKHPGEVVLVDSDEHDESGHITELAEVRVRMHDKRLRKMEYLRAELLEPEYVGDEAAATLLVAWGSVASPVREAIMSLSGADDATDVGGFGALLFGDIWPLPDRSLRERAAAAGRIINVEQNATGQLASLIREQTGITCSGSILKYDGRPLSAEEIVKRLKGGDLL